MGNLKCAKCGWKPENESHLDLHHLVPRGLGGKDSDGRIYLCGANKGNDCHRQLHQRINLWLKGITRRWLNETCY